MTQYPWKALAAALATSLLLAFTIAYFSYHYYYVDIAVSHFQLTTPSSPNVRDVLGDALMWAIFLVPLFLIFGRVKGARR